MDGFDTHELEEFERDLLSIASTKMPRESKKFLKKSATKLTKVNKNTFKSSGAAAGSGATEDEMLKRFKAGKVYKYNGDLNCRAYSGHPLTHLLDLGFIHKGGRGKKGVKGSKTGDETWVEGYHFMEKSKDSFDDRHYMDTQNFIEDMLRNNGL